MTLHSGDVVEIDGVPMTVDYTTPQGYWMKEGSSMYAYFHFKSQETIDDLAAKGRIKIFKVAEQSPPAATIWCVHEWKKYVGVTDVYQYCTRCDAKETKDWRTIRDEKEF